MPGQTDREQLIEQLLRRGLRGAPAAVPSPCLDAETLAAWADRALSPSQAAQVEHHLSNCARCQATVALFARTDAGQAGSTAPGAASAWLRWVVPIAVGAAAAALVLVVAWPRRGAAPLPAEVAARVDQAEPRGAAPTQMAQRPAREAAAPRALDSAEPAAARNSAAAHERAAAAEDMPRGVRADGGRSGGIPQAAPPPLVSGTETDARPREQVVLSSPYQAAASSSAPGAALDLTARPSPPRLPAAPAPAPAAAPVPAPPPSTAQEPRATMSNSSAPRGVASGTGRSAAAAGGLAERSLALRALPPVVSEFEGSDEKLAARPGAGGAAPPAVASAGRAGRAGSAPSIPIRWRILPSGDVERSPRGNSTWERIAIDPPAFIYAGDAPASRVCWLVGRGGVVLRTTDGLHFERLNVPDSANLVSVRALDANRATVTTIDGRTFSTIDGGLSWQSPLQETPAPAF